jgi:hypothetical protein
MLTRLSTKRQVADIDLINNLTLKRGRFYQHCLILDSERTSRESEMIAKHDAREADSRKAYEETIHALKAESESKRKTYEDAHEADSESEQKAYKDAILTHSEHILYMQGVVTKAETKFSTVRLAKKKCLLHFENLLQSERQERILLECQIKAHQRKAHLCEMEAEVKCIQNSEREARESERKVHLEDDNYRGLHDRNEQLRKI